MGKIEAPATDEATIKAAPPATTGKLTETQIRNLFIRQNQSLPPGQLFLHCENGLIPCVHVTFGFRGGNRSVGCFNDSSGQ